MTDDEFGDEDEIAAMDAYRAWREAVRRGHPSARTWRADYERLRGIDPKDAA